MEWNIDKIQELVEYINKELINGRPMARIEREDFGENERVIDKRLRRKGYKKIDNQYIFEGKNISLISKSKKDNKGIDNKNITTVRQSSESITKNNFSEEDIKSLKELITLIDPLKNVIQEYNNNITNDKYIDIEPIEVKINRKNLSGNIKQVGFRIDETILEEWKSFIKDYDGEYKVQDLIGEALRQFIHKYRK